MKKEETIEILYKLTKENGDFKAENIRLISENAALFMQVRRLLEEIAKLKSELVLIAKIYDNQ